MPYMGIYAHIYTSPIDLAIDFNTPKTERQRQSTQRGCRLTNGLSYQAQIGYISPLIGLEELNLTSLNLTGMRLSPGRFVATETNPCQAYNRDAPLIIHGSKPTLRTNLKKFGLGNQYGLGNQIKPPMKKVTLFSSSILVIKL